MGTHVGDARDLDPVLADLHEGEPGPPPEVRTAEVRTGERDAAPARAAADALSDDAWLLVRVPGRPEDEALAALRNALWPRAHVVAVYRARDGRLLRETLGGRERVPGGLGEDAAVLACRTRRHVLSPRVTAEKFDANADGWNGAPGSPGYGHFRWMRRLVGRFAAAPPGARILDFGCGAGWCGIEAARGVRGAALRFFDPSPEMVRIAEANARAQGVGDHEGRTGFGEAPPFPAEGEEPFDLVISSGVLSFSPDLQAWVEGLVRTVRPGGTLVLGDLNPESAGMRRRRRTRPLLPVRELNARPSGELRARLEGAGFRHEESAGYQLTRPVPQLMHLSETRLAGVLNPPLLLANRASTWLDRALGDALPAAFDSWVMRLRRG